MGINEKIILMYNEGFTILEISKQVKYPPTTVREILKENNIDTRRNRSMSEEKKQNIEALITSGLSYSKIADLLDVSLSSVKRVVAANNLSEIKKQAEKESLERLVLELYCSGMSQRDISKEVCVLSTTINKIQRKYGIIKDKKKQEAEALKLAYEGFTPSSISKYLRISFKTVKKMIKEHPDIVTILKRNDLPDKSNNAINHMFNNENKSYEEIARELQLPIYTIKHVINRKKGIPREQ